MMNMRIYYDRKPPWVRRFYNSKAWREKRVYILQRDHYLCQSHKLFGGKRCSNIANEVHHVKVLEDYPELALVDENLMSLCRDCHEQTKSFGKKKPPAGVRVIKA